jgi:GNAT superfamily N-acetyltransferase
LNAQLNRRPADVDEIVMGHSVAVVRRSQAEDESAVLGVLKAAFGQWPGSIKGISSAEHFAWKHHACPFGDSLGLVAVLDEEVVGFTAWIPWQVRNGGEIMRTMRGVDLAVSPAQHGHGIGGLLIDEAKKGVPAGTPFSWQTPNNLSRSSVIRSGAGAVDPVRRYARLVPRQTIRRMAGRRSGSPPQVEADTAAEVLRDGVDPALLEAFSSGPKARLATVKNLDYLRWRYAQIHGYHAIRADAERSDGPAVIFRVADRGRFSVAYISELLVEPGDMRTTRRLLRKVGRAAPVDFISCIFPSPREAARCGFLQLPGGPVPTVTPLLQALTPDPRRSASWELSLGDLELL